MTTDPYSLIRKIWSNSEGKYFFISTKSRTGRKKWVDKPFTRARISAAIQYAKSKADTHDVYMSTHGFSQPKRDREFSCNPHHFYADLDEANPKHLEIKPTLVFESSPGRFVGYWFADGPVSENLNQRLTYHVGADKSGWDRTQVLRVPGSRNYKYKEKPKVLVSWTDGPRYEVKRLEKVIPQLERGEGRQSGGEAAEIYEAYESQMPREVRRELTNPQVQNGKRSEVLWKLVNELIEVGMTKDEIFTVLWDHPWNKHAERRGGERQLEREIDKALGNHVGGSKKLKKTKIKHKETLAKRGEERAGPSFQFKTMSDVTLENIPWIIEGMMAPQQTTMWEGDPGVGKSYLLMWICRCLCDGLPLPWEDPKKHKRKPLRVLYCDMENSAGAVTKSRLIDNGLKNTQNYVQFEEPFSVTDPDSIDAFIRDVVEVFRPDIVVIDPVNIYVGSADTYKASETQQALQVFKDISVDYDFSLNLVRHLNKSHGGKALYAGGGSIAFAGVARIIATIGWHPEDADVRVVACTKNNLTTPFGSLGYTITPLPDTMGRTNRSMLEYIGRVDYTSDDILGTSNKKDDSSKNLASDLIVEMMGEENEVNYFKLLRAADGRSITELSIKKAAAELGLMKVSRGKASSRKTFLVKKG